MKKIERRIKKIYAFILEIVLVVMLYPLARILFNKKSIYIFSERGYEAQDNGYYLYKYFREKHPELEAYFVIDKSAIDLDRFDEKDKIIKYKSLKHRVIFYASKYCISTHIWGYTPNIDFYSILLKKGFFREKKLISLKHGITKDDIPNLYADKTKLDLLIAGAKPEYEYMLKHFNYTDEVLKYTGFARFDGLYEQDLKNQILIMPTWRSYLYLLEDDSFATTEYYHAWSRVLSDEKLMQTLEERKLQLVFYPHFELQKYVGLFVEGTNNVIIADKDSFDVQKLLKESKLLVTDYSSVFFDFAYMNKPCVYYHFDREKYLKQHYNKGYFDYETMGFGEVLFSHDEVIKTIINYIENDFELEDKYKARATAFFEIKDKYNCERIYNEIKNL